MNDWVNNAPLALLGLVVPALMAIAAGCGVALRIRNNRRNVAPERGASDGLEGYVVSAVLGLLALLMGFTFSLAVDRFEIRRSLVLAEANAIGTSYLQAQLLEEPHRTRLSRLLVAYVDNRIVLAKASPDRARTLVTQNDQLITDLWAATSAAFAASKYLAFSNAFVLSMNNLVDMDGARKEARAVHVPTAVFIVLFVDLIVTAGLLGYIFVGRRGRVAALFMFALLVLSLLLILDVDRPTSGGVLEDQTAMEQLKASLAAQPPAVFDRYLVEDAKAAR